MRDYHFTLKNSFRCLNFSEALSENFADEFSDSTKRENSARTGFVCTVGITEENHEKIVSFIEKNEIQFKDRDIFCSVCSDSEIWSIPIWVSKILRQVECQLTYSYTCVA